MLLTGDNLWITLGNIPGETGISRVFLNACFFSFPFSTCKSRAFWSRFSELGPHLSGKSWCKQLGTRGWQHCPPPPTQGVPTLSSRSSLCYGALASSPPPLQGWPHHEYAHTGLSHTEEDASAFHRSDTMATPQAPSYQAVWCRGFRCIAQGWEPFSGGCFTSIDISLACYWWFFLDRPRVTGQREELALSQRAWVLTSSPCTSQEGNVLISCNVPSPVKWG